MSTGLISRARANFATAAVLVLAMILAFAESRALPAAGAEPSSTADTLKFIERRVEAAYQRGDTAFLQSILRDDFRFTHASGVVEGKAETLANFAQPGNFLSRTLTAVEVEVHGDVALTTGRIEVRSAAQREYTVCYLRVYQRRGERWQLLSHRTFREKAGFTETCAPR